MKTAYLVTISIIVCVLFPSVQNFSFPDCSHGCNKDMCPTTPECKCGTYLDYCGCCSFCLRCPGEQCSLVANERCANGTTCKPPEGANAIMRINGPGWCK